VEIHDLTTLTPVPRLLGGWESKTVALLACGWDRVFFLDADAYCVADPGLLLDRLSSAEPFLFWEDFPNHRGAVNWKVWGLGASDLPSIQGGHFAIHFTHFWREFVLAHWLNQHSDFVYAHQYGDQDSWRMALQMTGGAYGCLGPARWDSIAFVCGATEGPLVVHRCQSKMFWPEDVTPGDSQSNRRLDRLPGEARAWAHWEALATRRAPEVFGHIYTSGLWGTPNSSGGGSTPKEARPYLDIVNGLARLCGWRRVVDLGCGDGWVASRLEAPEVVGVDCHGPHLERLCGEFPGQEWLRLDLDLDRDRLPAGDVAFLKDVLHHWPNRLVRDWLTWARTCGKWRWLVCTQDRQQATDDQDCPLGGYRGLDPALAPLRGLGLVPFCEYLHKNVLLLPTETAMETNG
jgi:SAM-dependent methyltransferase